MRFTITSISASGFAVVTDQSLPPARIVPARIRSANGYWRNARSRPMNGIVSSSICGSDCAQYDWQLATTPNCAKRAMSSGRTSCRWAM